MASSYDNDLLSWENTGKSIKDIINKNKLPALVKVSKDYYGKTNDENFSSGDLLKLDFVKTLTKVSASVGESETTHGKRKNVDINSLQWNNEILIPIGYKGKLQVIRSDNASKTNNTVQSLIKRFSQTDNEAKGGRNKKCTTDGTERALEREHPESSEDTGKIVSAADSVLYTLQEVIDKLTLPQYVKFVEREFEKEMTITLDEALGKFSGVLKLQEILNQKVVVGHQRAAVQKDKRSTSLEKSIILLPLESPLLKEIKILIPRQSQDTKEYKLFLTINFPNNVTMEQVNGTLCVELRRMRPKIYRLKDTREDTPRLLPSWVKHDQDSDKTMNPTIARSTEQTSYVEVFDVKKKERLLVQKGSNDSTHGLPHKDPKNDQHEYQRLTYSTEDQNPNTNRPLPLTPHPTSLASIPVGTVLPQSSQVDTTTFKFTSLSVSELADIFKQCKLKKLAELCKSEKLDGAFLNELSEEELRAKPFNLNSLQLKKYQQIQKGWTPNKSSKA